MTNQRLVRGIIDGGFRYVRFGTHAQDIVSDNIEIVNGLTSQGVECTWVFADYSVFEASAPHFTDARNQTAFENYNENTFGYAAAVQNAFVLDQLRRRLGWGHVKIVLPSTTGNWDDLLQYKPGVPYSEIANLHYYAGSVGTIDNTQMRGNLQASASWGEGYQRKWLTENGVRHAALPPTGPPNDSLMSDVCGGISLMRNALFTVSIPSVEKFAIYLINDEPERYGTGDSATYGLLQADGTPKASYRMFERLFTLIRDPVEISASPVPYTCSLGDNVVYQFPIAHSDGRTFIAFWQLNTQVTTNPDGLGRPWPAGTSEDIPPLPVSFVLPNGYTKVSIHRLTGRPPATISDDHLTLQTEALSDVQLLEITP